VSNELDEVNAKLDALTQNVASLTQNMSVMQQNMSVMQQNMVEMQQNMVAMQQNTNALREDMGTLRQRSDSFQGTMTTVTREGFQNLRNYLDDLNYEVADNGRATRLLRRRVARLERNDEE
jgi:septation ring formation regulator EzrA